MTNVVSFSIWGNDPLYCFGAIQNVSLVNKFYKGFECRFYCGSNVSIETVKKLESLGCNVLIEKVIDSLDYSWDGLFWRFYALEEDGIVLIRDVDSRINHREKAAVSQWINSEYDFHAMRDHIEHNVPILGGMFGVKNGRLKDIRNRIEKWGLDPKFERKDRFGRKGVDQDFLRNIVWEEFRTEFLVHDRYFNGAKVGDYIYNPQKFFNKHFAVQFPEHPEISQGSFVGEVIKVNNNEIS